MVDITCSPPCVFCTRVAEVVGALGLILPLATRITPVLSPIAATCLAIVMIGAAVVHLRHRDPAQAVLPSVVLGALSIASAILGFVTI